MNIYLHNRPFRALANASFLSSIGSVLFNFVFLVYAQTLPFKTLALSLVTAINLVPQLLAVPSGYLADHLAPRRRLTAMIGLRLVQAAAYVVLAFAIQAPGSLGLFAVLLAINLGSDLLADFTGSLVLHYQKHVLANQDEYQQGFGLLSGVGNIISLVFQALGASLIVLLHHNYFLFGLINAASFALAALVLVHDRAVFRAADRAAQAAQVQAPTAPESMGQGIGRALTFITRDRFLFGIIGLALGVNALGTGLDGLLTVLLANTPALWFGSFATTIAVVGVAASLSTTVAALFMHDGLKNWSLPALAAVTMMALAAESANLVWWHNGPAMVALLVIACYPVGKINPRLSAIVLARVDAAHLATVSSALQTLVMLGAPAGTAVFLGIANVVSPTAAWLVYGACAVAMTGVALAIARLQKRAGLATD
ncbi:MFS transporter [Lacticaseibacillus kribbianus]|uniref:MFS transporter n=1 Tax=Lacticaseibacillus kribbianus TaxID=2926292 RepID=UPI001CD4470F|nr:MFS transporter [Lacticaseibacillus kribbianus]